ncbi:MAG: Lrp/AsnC family transcriptional regulator [Cryobacterium sp.]|nr:Lrp/AsnC family transcriptional regulator [Cryobacterium sp.]
MDAIDRKILSILQSDARTTVTALADQVRVSVSACHRRLRELERSGVIAAYRAQLNPAAVGLGFQTLVFVTMREGGTQTLTLFEDALTAVPEVTDAHRLFGDPDYLVRVATQDLAAFQRLYDTTLASLPGVLRLSTTLIMKDVVNARPLSVPVGGSVTS